MAYASTLPAGPDIRLPSVRMPKFRWPRLSQRTRALLMIGVLISPSFLCDSIGYGVKRLFYTPEQIADMRSPDAFLSHIGIFQVACPAPDMTATQQERWAADAAQRGWPLYPPAGDKCFKPSQNMLGIVGLKVFSVACPTIVLAAAEQRQWVAYTATHDWTAYPQAGVGCVDP